MPGAPKLAQEKFLKSFPLTARFRGLPFLVGEGGLKTWTEGGLKEEEIPLQLGVTRGNSHDLLIPSEAHHGVAII